LADAFGLARKLGSAPWRQDASNVLIGIKFWSAPEATRPPHIGRLSADSGSTAKLETL